MMYSLTAYERETVILLNDEEDLATLYTCQKTMMTRLDKMCENNSDTYKLIKQDDYSKTYQFDKKLISFRSPREKRELSDEERKILGERLNNARINSTVQNNT